MRVKIRKYNRDKLGRFKAVRPMRLDFNFAKKFAVAVLVFGLMLQGGGFAILKTSAYFSDSATSSANTLTAGTLQYVLSGSDFSPATIKKGETSARVVDISNTGSLGFKYVASAADFGADTDLCDALTLQADLATTTVYSGLLQNFVAATTTFDNLSPDWHFTVSLPASASDSLQDKSCGFKFIYSGWQENFSGPASGFTDVQETSSVINSGHWVTPQPGDIDPSPIIDATVNQANPANNYGSICHLSVESRNTNKNQRSFIRFNFNLPVTTTINSASLDLFMSSAPASSRTYQLKRALSSWDELGITWDNQPASGTVVSSATTGTADNQLLAWDVKTDVQNFVTSPSDNYGWVIGESSEDAGGTGFNASFVSRNAAATNPDHRPLLQINFTVPPAATDHMVINEVYPNIGPGKGNDPRDEWVEIYNPTAAPLTMADWKICDNTSCDALPTTTLPSLGFGVIITSTSQVTGNWSIPSGAAIIYLDNTTIGNGLSNTGDRVELKDAGGNLVDAMSYGTDHTYFSTLAAPQSGNSLARVVKGYDTDSAVDWVESATPNPGTNPGLIASGDGSEVIRFTSDGIMIAANQSDLPAIDAGTDQAQNAPSLDEPDGSSVLPAAVSADMSGSGDNALCSGGTPSADDLPVSPSPSAVPDTAGGQGQDIVAPPGDPVSPASDAPDQKSGSNTGDANNTPQTDQSPAVEPPAQDIVSPDPPAVVTASPSAEPEQIILAPAAVEPLAAPAPAQPELQTTSGGDE